MKILIIGLTHMLITTLAVCQQCSTLSKSCSYEGDPFGIMGVGNLNTEAFEKANASGKIMLYVRLMQHYDATTEDADGGDSNLTFYLGLNKNVTRNDSLSIKSILYPDLGNIALQGTLEYSYLVRYYEDRHIGHYIAPFVEGWIKDFKVDKSDSAFNRFVTVNTSLGVRYIWHFTRKTEEDGEERKDNVFFSAGLYYTSNNILSKDRDDYFALTTEQPSGANNPLKYNSLGLKLSIEYNKFQIFADMRRTFGGEEKIPNREIRGFSYNIGLVTSTSIFGID